jgi:hypothetical protein
VTPIINPTGRGFRVLPAEPEAAREAKPGGNGGGAAAAVGEILAGTAGGIGTTNGWVQFGQLTVAPPSD